MRRRRSVLIRRGTVAATSVVVLGTLAACEAKVYGLSGPRPDAPHLTLVAPQAPADGTPVAAPNQLTPFDGLEQRAQQAVSDAATKGADISVVVLDRDTDRQVSAGQNGGLVTASVAKLFIADDLLMRQPDLSPDDRKKLDIMLQSSDDNSAEEFWNRNGGDAIITRVAARYGLTSTGPPNNGRWWNTISTPQDLVRYYDMLLDGTGGLPPSKANTIVNSLALSTATGIDGYPQRFGIPDGVVGEPVAVKQGWMCCIGSDWMHLSTGVIGVGRRFVMVIYSLQPSDDATARATITQAVKTMFPAGRI